MTIAHTHVTRHWAVLIRQSDYPTGEACQASSVAKLIKTTLAMGPLGQWPLCQMARPPPAVRRPRLPSPKNGSYTPENPCKTKTEEPNYTLQLCVCCQPKWQGLSPLGWTFTTSNKPTKKKVNKGSRFVSKGERTSAALQNMATGWQHFAQCTFNIVQLKNATIKSLKFPRNWLSILKTVPSVSQWIKY